MREEMGTWRYLLLRAYRNWDFPKGVVEPDEEPFAAALRETQEETGITQDALAFRWGQRYFETEPYNGKVARYYLAASTIRAVSLGINPMLGRPEHHEYRWVSYDEAIALLVPRLQRIIAQARMVMIETDMRAGANEGS